MNRKLLFAGIFVFLVFSDALFSADAMIAYRSNTSTCKIGIFSVSPLFCPKLRIWDDAGTGTWGHEITLSTSQSVIRHLVLINSPVSSKNVLVVQGDDGLLDGYVCAVNCSIASSWTRSSNIADVGTDMVYPIPRRFDIDFEKDTGDAVLVYSVDDASGAHDLGYKVLPAASSSFAGIAESYINDAGHAGDIVGEWVELDPKPTAGSEEIVLVSQDWTNKDINAWVWDGASWGHQTDISLTTHGSGVEPVALKYTKDGTQAMALGEYDYWVGGVLTNRIINYKYWDGTAWSNPGSFDPTPGETMSTPGWFNLKANFNSQKHLEGVVVTDAPKLVTIMWSGTGWSFVEVDPSTDVTSQRGADFEWDYEVSDSPPPSNTGKVVWDTDDFTGDTLSYRTCKSAGCTGLTSTTSSYAGTAEFLNLYRNPSKTDAVDIIGIRQARVYNDSGMNIGSFRYSADGGFVNYGDSVITSDVGEAFVSWFTPLYSLAYQ